MAAAVHGIPAGPSDPPRRTVTSGRSTPQDASSQGLALVQEFQQYCTFYGTPPCLETAGFLRFAARVFRAPASFGVDRLLPLVDVLLTDDNVRELDFSGSKPMGDVLAYAMAELLAHNHTITHLNLSRAGISADGAIAVARAVERSPALVSLVLRGNDVGTAGAAAFGRVIRRNKSLRFLDVSNCSLQLRGVHEITSSLKARAAELHLMSLREESAAPATAAAPGEEPAGHRGTLGGGASSEASSSGTTSSSSLRTTLAAAAATSAAPKDIRSASWIWGGPQSVTLGGDRVVRAQWDTRDGKASGGTGVGGGVWQARQRRGRREHASDGHHAPGSRGSSSSSALPLRPGGADAPFPELTVRIGGNLVREEVWNAVVHGIGLLLAAIGAFPLLQKARSAEDRGLFFGCVAYCVGINVFFASSTLRHSLFLADSANLFQLVDHSAVFVLVACTYSPFLLANMAPVQPLASLLLVAVWALALAGVAVCSFGWTLPRWRDALPEAAGWLPALRLLPRAGLSVDEASAARRRTHAGSIPGEPGSAAAERTDAPPGGGVAAQTGASEAGDVTGQAGEGEEPLHPRADTGEEEEEAQQATAAAGAGAQPVGPPQQRGRSASSSGGVARGPRSASSRARLQQRERVAAYALLEDTLDPPGQRNLRMVLYVIAGWLGLIPFFTHYQCLPPAAWYLLGFGGIIFSCGTLLYQRANRAHPSRPTSYYILVVLAAALHYSAIMRYAGAPTEACLASARGTLDVWSLLLSWLPGMA